jgi:hypothetical protein
MNIAFAGLKKCVMPEELQYDFMIQMLWNFTNKRSVKLSMWQGNKTMDEV